MDDKKKKRNIIINIICFVVIVVGFHVLCFSLAKTSSSNKQCQQELEYCAYLLESAYSQQDDRMDKIMKNLENNMEKTDALYNDVINNLK